MFVALHRNKAITTVQLSELAVARVSRMRECKYEAKRANCACWLRPRAFNPPTPFAGTHKEVPQVIREVS